MSLPWSRDIAEAVLACALAHARISESRPKIISFRQNAIVHLADNDLSLRIYGPQEDQTRATRMVACAHMLQYHNFPAIRIAPVFAEQPTHHLGYQVSVWHWIKQDSEKQNTAFLFGRLLRQFHDLPTAPDVEFEPFDPVAKIRQRLHRLRTNERISAADCNILSNSLDRAIAMADGLRNSTLGYGLIHGDAMPGNAILSGGQLIMIDLDSVSLGAREWDLVPMAVVAKRFSQDQEQWRNLLAGYGVKEEQLPGLQAASLIKQLTMTAYLCLSAGQSPEIDAEIRRRLAMWANWDMEGRWGSGFTVAQPD